MECVATGQTSDTQAADALRAVAQAISDHVESSMPLNCLICGFQQFPLWSSLSRGVNWGLSPQLCVMPDAQTIIRCLSVRQRMEIYAGRGN